MMLSKIIGFELEQAMEHGALEAFTIPISMKKWPGLLLAILRWPVKSLGFLDFSDEISPTPACGDFAGLVKYCYEI